LAHCTK
jgi:serine/threonine protein kinase